MNSKIIPGLICAISAAVMGGCSSTSVNKEVSSYNSSVKPVMTEYSQALQCVGGLIEQSNAKPLTVYVRKIKDETVPTRYRKRRLSRGGAWWFHTAIDKMRTSRVTSVVKMPKGKDPQAGNVLVVRGAWTQDDQKVGVNGKQFGVRNLTSWLDKLGWYDEQKVSVIAADFVSTRGNNVVHASAISLAVNGSDNSYQMRIEDGARKLNVGLFNEVNEGPQFAQRRIAEAAALVHVARAFNVDYRPCVEQGAANPSSYQAKMRAYMAASEQEQFQKLQQALTNAGYYQGEVDGKWGAQSEQALSGFLVDQGLAVTGQPSSEHFALLLKFDTEVGQK